MGRSSLQRVQDRIGRSPEQRDGAGEHQGRAGESGDAVGETVIGEHSRVVTVRGNRSEIDHGRISLVAANWPKSGWMSVSKMWGAQASGHGRARTAGSCAVGAVQVVELLGSPVDAGRHAAAGQPDPGVIEGELVFRVFTADRGSVSAEAAG